MKTTNIVLAVLFVLFAVVQINDPDPWAWVALYLYVGVLFALAAFGRVFRPAMLVGMAACLVWLALLLPEFINWVNMGMPTITGSMTAEEPHIEYTREFLGLFISMGALGFLYYKTKAKKTAS